MAWAARGAAHCCKSSCGELSVDWTLPAASQSAGTIWYYIAVLRCRPAVREGVQCMWSGVQRCVALFTGLDLLLGSDQATHGSNADCRRCDGGWWRTASPAAAAVAGTPSQHYHRQTVERCSQLVDWSTDQFAPTVFLRFGQGRS